MKILIAEDDRTIASGLEYSLNEEGYSVTLCYDVKSANECLYKNKYDLCILHLSRFGIEKCKIERLRLWVSPTPTTFKKFIVFLPKT